MPTITPLQDQEVEVTEQGTIKFDEEVDTPAGIGVVTMDMTVPIGKKWLLKFAQLTTSAFNGTITAYNLRMVSGATNFTIKGETAAFSHELIAQIPLSEGDKIRAEFNVTAYTSGSLVFRTIYLESDI